MKPRIIGLAGASGAGKDVVAKYLVENHGYRRVGFSDALKEEVIQKFHRTLEAHVRDVLPATVGEYGVEHAIDAVIHWARTPLTRALLQEFGSEVRRADNPSYWTIKWIQRMMKAGNHIVTPDVRFDNELGTIKAWGGVIAKVVRPGHTLPDSVGSHQSEAGIPDNQCSIILINDSTVSDLCEKADGMLDHPSVQALAAVPRYQVISGRST